MITLESPASKKQKLGLKRYYTIAVLLLSFVSLFRLGGENELLLAISTTDQNNVHYKHQKNLTEPTGNIASKGNTSSTDQHQKNNNDDDRPTFVLHVGPPKTGTTTIQSTMQSRRIKKLLSKDHYSLIPHVMIHQTSLVEEFETVLVPKMKELRISGNNVFGSSEYLIGLNKTQCRHWKEVLVDQLNFRLEIVMVHRRFHQLWPSGWNQWYKFKRINDVIVSFRHDDWPGINNDIRIPTIEESLLDHNISSYPGKRDSIEIHRAFDRWKDIADKVTVFDMHESRLMLDDGSIVDAYSDLVQNFVCSVLPGTNHTCHDYPPAAVGGANKAKKLDYDILAVHAYESGLITDKTLWRDDVFKWTSQHAVRNNITLPMKCPAKEVLDDVYKHSLHMEKWAKARTQFANEKEELSPDQLADFNADWEISKNKFCNVDAAKALEDERWKSFFRDLKSTE